jgi:hypothetical protein
MFAAVRDVEVPALDDPSSVVRRGKRRRSARLAGRSGLVVGVLVAVVALVGPTLRTPKIGPLATPEPLPSPSVPAAETLLDFQGTSSYEQVLLDGGVTREELRSSANAVVACTEHHGYGTDAGAAYDIVSGSYNFGSYNFGYSGITTGQRVSPDDCMAWFHDDVARAWSKQLFPRTPQQERDLHGQVVDCLERERGVAYDGPRGIDELTEHITNLKIERAMSAADETSERVHALLDAYDACTLEP